MTQQVEPGVNWLPDIALTAAQAPIYHAMRPLKQHQHGFMIDGRTMTFRDFLDELAPGDDNPMRTFLTLKYGGWNE
jgi:hypothetical protein